MTVNNEHIELLFQIQKICEQSMFLVPIIMVWRWDILGVVLAIVTDLVIFTIPGLLGDQLDPSKVHDQGPDEYLFVMIVTLTIFGFIIFIYCLFILLIKRIIESYID